MKAVSRRKLISTLATGGASLALAGLLRPDEASGQTTGLNAELEHANIRLNSRIDHLLRLLVVTPNMHKVHHSRDQRETDSNYSNIFSIWDRLFDTYTSATDFRSLSYGLDGFDVKEKQSLRGLLKMPFMNHNRV